MQQRFVDLNDAIAFDPLDVPGAELNSEEAAKFNTYRNYLTVIAEFTNREYGKQALCFAKMRQKSLAAGLAQPPVNKKLTDDDHQTIQKALFNCWNTELVLRLPANIDRGLVRYSNHWSPVQAYYAVYLCLHAYLRSSNIDVRNSHTAALNTISNQIQQRKLLLPFWNIYCTGEPTKAPQYHNLPAHVVVNQVSALSTPRQGQFWDWYGMLLRTTRERQLDRKLSNPETRNRFRTKSGTPRKSYTAVMRSRICDEISGTTIFDCLYRLRLRSNYEDADSFLLGNLSDTDAFIFHQALCKITSCTLYGLERLIAHKIGKKRMDGLADAFARADKNGLSALSVLQRKPFWL